MFDSIIPPSVQSNRKAFKKKFHNHIQGLSSDKEKCNYMPFYWVWRINIDGGGFAIVGSSKGDYEFTDPADVPLAISKQLP